ncbi:hypothetical protein, conserved [Eimeria acervulina]|uniref:Uncharacterized protein n=1 Tax=Eimeria acervulina TaxID=5801 RepID=U6GEE7_EIMAC|nr:hypothetical protein, conserved [Eimeria acervulina]CDI78621.1 hypothetical protein, conserved [Eimeria acervulina]
MKAATCLFVAACLSVAVVKGETRGLLQSFYKYDVCRKDFLNIAATGDTKSPACWKFSRTEDPAERYKAFTAEITSRPFSFYGPRDKILKRLEAYAPPSIDLKTHRASLLQHGFEASTVPSTVKEEVLDLIAFLCCLSKQATDVKWTDEQIKRWESLGLDVQAELAKKVFEPPTPTGPPREFALNSPDKQLILAIILFGLEEATLTLPSGARASLHFIPAKNIFRVLLPKAVEDCSLEDFREGLAKQKEEIQKKLLQQSKQSELEEARKVDFWELKEIFVPAEINNIIEAARKNEVVGFTVSEEKAESIPPPSPPPVPARRKKAPRHVSFGLEEATLTLPSGARASLHFEPTKHTFEVMLPKDLEECSIEDFREGLAKQSEEIQKELLQKSKHSELEEARKVNSWNLKEIFVPTEIKDIVEIAKKNGVVGFTVSGKQECPLPSC